MINIDALNDDEKLAALESIHKSIEKSKEIQKKKITTNVELIVKALKKIESDFQQRYDETGKLIANLKSGEDGRDGKDGKDGKNGLNGRDGPMGPRGYDGLPGRNGIDGEDGVSITDAHIDFDGSLIISLSSGRVINVGEVVTPDIAEKIKVITNGGGTSQSVLDAIASLQAQISGITSGLDYQGTWNASTNTPALASGMGTNGYYYIVSTAGSTNLDGVTDWQIGDWAVFNGSVWQKLDQTDIVTSVAGRTGAVTLSNTDISGLGTMSTQNSSSVSISGGTVSGITDLAIADGGTGQSTAAAAITALTGTQVLGRYLRSNGTNAVLSDIVAGDVPTLNQNTTGSAATLSQTNPVSRGGTNLTSLTNKGVLYASSTSQVATSTGLQFDGTNFGMGATPSSWGSTFKAIEIGNLGVLSYESNGSIKKTYLSTNSYNATNTGARPYYKENGLATEYYQNVGEHVWSTAPTGIAGSTTTITTGKIYTNLTAGNQATFGAVNGLVGTIWTATSSGTLSSGTVVQNIDFVEAMRIDASANVGIGIAPGSKLDVKGTLRLSGSTSGYVGFAPAATAGSTTYTLPSADGTANQALVTNGSGVLSWASTTTGTVTSVGATVPSFLSVSGSPITSSGTLAITLSGTALPTANGGTGLTSFTSGGIAYASSSSALTTGSALQFDGTNLLVGTTTSTYNNSGRSCIELNGSTDSLIAFKSGGTSSGYLTGGSATLSLYATGASTVLTFGTNGAERARIDTSGNFGLGVTPSAWGSFAKAFEQTAGSLYYNGFGLCLGNNHYFNGTSYIYKNNGSAALYSEYSGQHIWYNAPSGLANTTTIVSGRAYAVYAIGSSTLGQWQAFFSGLSALPTVGQNITATATGTLLGGGTVSQAITFTQAMTLNSSGQFLVGTTTAGISGNANTIFTAKGNADTYASIIASGNEELLLASQSGITKVGAFSNHPLLLITNNTERLRLDSSGNLGLGVTPSAWTNSFLAYEIQGGAITSNGTGSVRFVQNAYYNSSSWLYKTTALASRYEQDSGIHLWYNAPSGTAGTAITFTERMRLDSSGILGLGVTPSAWVDDKAVQLPQGSISSGYEFGISVAAGAYRSASNVWRYTQSSTFVSRYNQVNGAHQWFTAPTGTAGNAITFTQAMTLDASGNLLVGTTSGADKFVVNQTTANAASLFINASGTAATQCSAMWHKNTTGDPFFVQFFTEATATSRGSITYNRAGGLVVYNTTSDYRAKDIIGNITDSGSVIDSVPVYMGKMKGATQERPMFIAHETPVYAHTGEKDAVDADGNPVYQQMDASALIPVMWAEIQSLRKRLADAGL